MMAAEASLEREKTPSRLPSAAPPGRTRPPGGAEPPPAGKTAVRSFRRVFVRLGGLLGEGCVRVLAEQLFLLQLAAPGVASGAGGPLEVIFFPVGQFMAMKGRPVSAAEPPPQDAREGREEAPESRAGPDGSQVAEADVCREREDCGEERQAKSREYEDPRGAGTVSGYS